MLNNLAKKITLNWQLIVLIILAVGFFGIYSWLSWQQPVGYTAEPKLVLNSPDETANFFLADQFAKNSSLTFADPANEIANGLVSPRSLRVIGGQTAPAGFIGLPLVYGLLAKLGGSGIILFITPLLAVLGIIFFYLLVKLLFDKNAAFISALLAFILPGLWYYSGKSMMPNVPFVVMLILSLYFLTLALKNKRLTGYLLFGVFLGLAMMIRTSEFVWLLPLLLLIVLFNLKNIRWLWLTLGILTSLVVFSPVFYFNWQIYGSPLSVGYALKSIEAGQNILSQGLNLFQQIFLPFGFHPKTALLNFYHYTIVLFPLWSLITALCFIAGLIYSTVKFKTAKKLFYYLIGLLLIGGYLILFYGSWNFHDHPDPSAVTIGTSYVRYWLPFYIFSLPLVGWSLSKFFGNKIIFLTIATVMVFSALALPSYQRVMLGEDEGLVKVNQNLKEYQQITKEVTSKTETEAVIIAGRMDKVFFPERRVIYELVIPRDYYTVAELIAGGYPVYYFDFTITKEDLDYLNNTLYNEYNLKIQPAIIDFSQQSLYPITLTTNN